MQLDNKLIYQLGQRDAIALMLMEAKYENRKLPKEAMQYQEQFGDHVTLEFHLS